MGPNKLFYNLFVIWINCVKLHGLQQTVEYETRNYSCTSYFIPLDEDYLRFYTQNEIRKHCPENLMISPVQIYQKDDNCIVKYAFNAPKSVFEAHPNCRKAVNLILKEGIESAYGSEWGCPTSKVHIFSTKFYPVLILAQGLETMSITVVRQSFCVIKSLHLNASVSLICKMNSHGGYNWEVSNADNCGAAEFHNPTFELMEKLEKSKIYCSLRIFLLYGYMKTSSLPPLKRIKNILEKLYQTCDSKEQWVFPSMYEDLYTLFDTMIHSIARIMFFSKRLHNNRVFLINVMEMMGETLRHVYNFSNTRVFHRSRFILFFSFPSGANIHFFKCGAYFEVEILHANSYVTVTCLDKVPVVDSIYYNGKVSIVSGVVGVNAWYTPKIIIRTRYSFPTYRINGHYICGHFDRYGEQYFYGIKESCRIEKVAVNYITCACAHPGYYALIQVGADSVQLSLIHEMNNPSVRMIYYMCLFQTVVTFLIYTIIRTLPKERQLYSGPKRKTKSICWILDVTIYQLFVHLFTLSIQLYIFGVFFANQCRIPGILINTSYWMSSLLNLTTTIGLFIFSRSHSVYLIVFKLLIFDTVVGIVSCLVLYFIASNFYFQFNCLPLNLKVFLAIPNLTMDSLSGLFLIFYWIFRPYRNLDEWIGLLIYSCSGIILWSLTLFTIHPGFSMTSTTIRIIMSTFLRIYGYTLYHGVFKWGVIKFYCRFIYDRLTKICNVFHETRSSNVKDSYLQENDQTDQTENIVLFPREFEFDRLPVRSDTLCSVSGVDFDYYNEDIEDTDGMNESIKKRHGSPFHQHSFSSRKASGKVQDSSASYKHSKAKRSMKK